VFDLVGGLVDCINNRARFDVKNYSLGLVSVIGISYYCELFPVWQYARDGEFVHVKRLIADWFLIGHWFRWFVV
jgi:hypothetical protein